MLLEFQYIVKYVRGLMAHTDETWDTLSKGEVEESKPDYMMSHYYWPLFGIAAICIMLLIGYGGIFGNNEGFNLEVGMKAMVRFVVIYAVGPTLISIALRPLCIFFANIEFQREQLELYVHYAISTVMVLDVACAFFPNLEFLGFSKLYLLYIVAMGVTHFLKVDVRDKNSIVTVNSLLLFWAVPKVIGLLLNLFVNINV